MPTWCIPQAAIRIPTQETKSFLFHLNMALPRAIRTMKHCPLKTPEGLSDPDRSITILFDEEED